MSEKVSYKYNFYHLFIFVYGFFLLLFYFDNDESRNVMNFICLIEFNINKLDQN